MSFYNIQFFKLKKFLFIILGFLITQLFLFNPTLGKKLTKKKIPPPSHFFLLDTLLDKGIIYQKALINLGGNKYNVSILKANLEVCDCEPAVLKAGKRINLLDKLQNIIQFYDSLGKNYIYGAVNANFWRAYSNYPIGPVIIDGEVVQFQSYKEWSSIFFNEFNIPFIENFKLSAVIKFHKNKTIEINDFNKRIDSNSVIIYNKYGGPKIPYIDNTKIEEIISQFKDNNEVINNDSTEEEFNIELMREELAKAQLMNSMEYSTKKIKFKYLTAPAINKNIHCIVEEISLGEMDIPSNGFVLSIGNSQVDGKYLQPGDTAILRINTNLYKNQIFKDGISGTPRLVRNGIAKHEAQKEGSTKRRFIYRNLPRTAIGYDRKKKIIYLVTVKATNSQEKTIGASLQALASIMKYIGCYNAMNLDGGSSTIMVINGKNVLNNENPYSSRKISVGIGIRKIAD